jgi:hypothetical protein
MKSTTSLVPTTAPTEPTLIKTDVLGRMHRTCEQRQQILNEYERSGLSGPKFAALCGVKYQTFASWLQRRKRERNLLANRPCRPGATKKVQWLEARLQPGDQPPSGTGLLVHLPGGARAEITHPQHIGLAAALVRALEKPC